MDTQKLFTFTVGHGNFTNVNLNFLCWVRKKMCFSGFAFRRLSVNDLNKVFEIFSRSCNTLLKFMLDKWGMLSSVQFAISTSELNWEFQTRISDHELYVPFNFTLSFRLVKYECNSFIEGISTPYAWSLTISSSGGKQSKTLDKLTELQMHHLRPGIFFHFSIIGSKAFITL